MTDDDVITGVIHEHRVIPLRINVGARTKRQEEAVIDISQNSNPRYFILPGQTQVRGTRLTIITPFVGATELWHLTPSTHRLTFPVGSVERGHDENSGNLIVTFEFTANQDLAQLTQLLVQNDDNINFYIQQQLEQIELELNQWPSIIQQAIIARRQLLKKHDELDILLGIPSGDTRRPSTNASHQDAFSKNPTDNIVPTKEQPKWDVFISHASEDKDDFVRPLAKALMAKALNVWYDEFTLKVGDSLRRSIDNGLGNSKYGIVVISPSFLAKDWPQKELDGLVSRERDGQKVILPIWHKIDESGVRSYSPILADRFAALSKRGVSLVAEEIISVIKAG
ncbi:MAG: toll/interleukin-1 receptor domain-containing protein [Gammaproteobacteria bacterium]